MMKLPREIISYLSFPNKIAGFLGYFVQAFHTVVSNLGKRQQFFSQCVLEESLKLLNQPTLALDAPGEWGYYSNK